MMLGKLRTTIADYLSALSNPARVALIAIVCGLAGTAILWIFNQVSYYYLARSYAEEIADAYDLNRDLTNALIWFSFALILVFAKYTFSFSKRKRLIGSVGLFSLLIAHSLIIGRLDVNFRRAGESARCYVLMRDSVKILNRTGIDPESGRECRSLTPDMVEKIGLYNQGNRPNRITSVDGPFFNPLSGEPIAWYAKSETGDIELFDLMGFHPRTGDELIPVNRQVVEAWKNQNAKIIKRPPVRVDPEKSAFFDPVTGAARIWFWRNEAGEYEFYDGPGFQPRTGDALTAITKDVITDWRQMRDAAATKKRQDQERQDRETRERAELAQRELQQRTEQDRIAKQAEADALQRQQQASKDCDSLAANPTDARRAAEGVNFDTLKLQADQAFDACNNAVSYFPNELRYQYQLGRAAQFKDKKRAFELFTSLTAAKYPAAFDNLGGMYLERKDIPDAIRIFRVGEALGDADSMVSLAELAERGYYGRPDPVAVKWELLSKAAELGHEGAQKAIAEERARSERAAAERANEQEAARNAAAMFGTILQGIGRR